MRVEGGDYDCIRYIEHRIGGDADNNGITILITGFGPFREHVVNASWQTVRLIPEKGINLPANIGPDTPINLVIYEIPVIYKLVGRLIPELWEKHQPDLVIHVGVSGIAKAITVEQNAHNCGYSSTDIMDSIPEGNVCVVDGCDVMESGFEMKEVVNRVNCSGCGVHAEISYDPGRYLCDFIYYQSLNINKDRTAFIHVPPLGKPWSAEEMSDAVRVCITELLYQLQERNALSVSSTSSSSRSSDESNESYSNSDYERNRL